MHQSGFRLQNLFCQTSALCMQSFVLLTNPVAGRQVVIIGLIVSCLYASIMYLPQQYKLSIVGGYVPPVRRCIVMNEHQWNATDLNETGVLPALQVCSQDMRALQQAACQILVPRCSSVFACRCCLPVLLVVLSRLISFG